MSQRLEQLRKLHQADPAEPFCTYGIALEYAKAGQTEQAIQWLDKTLTLDPGYYYAYYQKAKALIEAGQEQAAALVLRQGMDKAAGADDPQARHAREELAALLDTL